jgi:hypothetical protein
MARLYCALCFLVCFLSPVLGAADKSPITFNITSPGQHSDLNDHQIYEIKYVCGPKQDLPTNFTQFDTSMAGALFHINRSVVHQIMVTTGLPSADPSTLKIVLPTSSLSLFTLFGVSATAGVLGDWRTLCSQSIYVEGGAALYLIATASWSKQYTEGPVLAALYAFGSAISPLWSLFLSPTVPPAVTSKVTNADATEAPLKAILADLSTDLTFGKSTQLKTGVYHVTTTYSDVTITVSKVSSLVRAPGGGQLLQEFRKQVDGATEKISATNVRNTCDLLATDLGNTGFSQDEDVPYGLAYIASRSLSTKPDMLTCLGQDYALAAAKLGPILWSYMPPSKAVSVQDAQDTFPPPLTQDLQPPYATVDQVFNDFVLNLNRLGQDKPQITAQALPLLKNDIAPTVLINDHTSSFLFTNYKTALDAQGLSQALAGLNMHRFGCQSQMKATYGDNPEGAVAVFLAFATPAASTSTTFDKITSMRPIFKAGQIASVIVSDDQDAIKALLSDHSSSCQGLTVTQPVAAAGGAPAPVGPGGAAPVAPGGAAPVAPGGAAPVAPGGAAPVAPGGTHQ